MDLFSYQPPPTYPSGPGYSNDSTSKAAAADVAESAGTIRGVVLRFIAAAGAYGATTNEIAEATNISRDNVQPRTSELKVQGKIVDSGDRRHNANGKKAIVWKLAANA